MTLPWNLKQLILGAQLGFARTGSKIYAAGTGTVGVTNGSTALVGSGTNFDPQIGADSTIVIASDATGFPQGRLVTVSGSPASDTAATLTSAWLYDTATGLTFYYESGALVAKLLKPASSVPAHWLSLGDCLEADYQRNADFDAVVAAQNGPYEQTGELYKGSKPKIKVTLNEVSEPTMESVFGTGQLTNGTAATPFAGDGQLKGWWQLKKKDTAGNLILNLEVYGHGHFSGMKAMNGHLKPELEISVFKVSGNAITPTLANAS